MPPKNYNDVFEKYDFNNYEDCLKATKNIDYVIMELDNYCYEIRALKFFLILDKMKIILEESAGK